MDTSSGDVLNQENINQPMEARIVGNFPKSSWGDYFTDFTLDNELFEKYSRQVEELKGQVLRSMLICDDGKPSEKMVLIDILERLGVAYHFEDEIEEILEQLFGKFEYNDDDYDLYNVALHFRIFRQHGYNMSCEVFNKFKGGDGKLKETLEKDAVGMLSLYEATYLAQHGDDILDEALVFTKCRLQAMIPDLSSDFSEQVKRSMSLCLHRSLPRIEARNYINVYGSDPMANQTLLSFAKTDYNFLQLLHRQELSNISKWWKDLASKFPYARDRIVEGYFYVLGVYFEPHYSFSRVALTKTLTMIAVLDDTYDAYGTLDELKVFTDAVERWDDAEVIKELPDYLKILHKTLLDLHQEFEQQFTAHGVSHVKQEVQNLVRSYYIEAEWFIQGHLASFNDYFTNGLVTSTYLLLTPASFLGMKEETINKEAFDWLRTEPKALIDIATISRLLSDIGSYEVEKARGQIVTGIECYMNQYGVSKEDAVKEFNNMVEKSWKDFNEECLKPTPIPKRLLERLLNWARLIEVFYRKGDGYTHPEEIIDGYIISMLKNLIPLL